MASSRPNDERAVLRQDNENNLQRELYGNRVISETIAFVRRVAWPRGVDDFGRITNRHDEA